MVVAQVPKWIDNRIGTGGYEALKYLLGSDTIETHKLAWSDRAKCDIGTPETVRRMVLSALIPAELYQLHNILPAGSDSYWGSNSDRQKMRECCKDINLWQFVKLTAAGYLLGTDFSSPRSEPKYFAPESACTKIVQDHDGKHQLEGELRRYWAQRSGMRDPREVSVDMLLINHYCGTHGLGEFNTAFAETMAWQPLPK